MTSSARTIAAALAKLLTVFGLVTALRMSYGACRHASLSPLDASLNLPEELQSHGLRRLAAIEAARGSFDATVEAIERNTGTKVPKRQVEGLVKRAAQDFDAFYDQPASAEPAASETDLMILTLDGKGIVMRREDLREATRKAAESAQHKLDRRLSKGEKKDRKRMATVAAVYDLTPQARRPEDVLAELRPVRDASKPRPPARNKRVWASVEKSAVAVTSEVFEEAHRRDPGCRRRWVVLVDGDRHQIARIRAEAKRRGMAKDITLVVDFIHVLEYLWDAAWCFFEQGDKEAKDLRDLEGERADAARGSVDAHPIAWANPGEIAQRLERRRARQRSGCGLLERAPARHGREMADWHGDVLCHRSPDGRPVVQEAEDPFAGRVSTAPSSHLDDLAREVEAHDLRKLHPAE